MDCDATTHPACRQPGRGLPRQGGLPHLLPEVVPLIAQPLVDYLVERCRSRGRKPVGAAGEATAAALESWEA